MDHDNLDNTHIPHIKAAITRLKKANAITPAGKKLRAYLIRKNMSVPQLALRTGFNPETLYQYTTGVPESYPSLAQAYAIEYATAGEVKAWEWLDNPYIERRVRKSNLSMVRHFEGDIKSFVLKFKSLSNAEGMLRHKARLLSRLFGVEWGEVKRRVWEDAKERSKVERADVSKYLMRDISQEEHDGQEE